MTNEQKTKVAYASFFALKMKTHNYTIGETVGKILNIMGIDCSDEDFEEIVQRVKTRNMRGE
jgi:hypothetical protein